MNELHPNWKAFPLDDMLTASTQFLTFCSVSTFKSDFYFYIFASWGKPLLPIFMCMKMVDYEIFWERFRQLGHHRHYLNAYISLMSINGGENMHHTASSIASAGSKSPSALPMHACRHSRHRSWKSFFTKIIPVTLCSLLRQHIITYYKINGSDSKSGGWANNHEDSRLGSQSSISHNS